MEIEKKFTIKELPKNLDEYVCLHIKQGYLNRKPVIRIRKSNDDYILTYKQKMSKDNKTIVNIEEEFPLNEESFNHLVPKCDGNIVEKRRYKIPLYDDLVAELDVFEGYLSGLVFAEVEFKSVEQAAAFVKPDWFLEDVTDKKMYSNGVLSSINNLNELSEK